MLKKNGRSTQPSSSQALLGNVYVFDDLEFIYLSKSKATLIVPRPESYTPRKPAFQTGVRLTDHFPDTATVAQHLVNSLAVDFTDGQLIGEHRFSPV